MWGNAQGWFIAMVLLGALVYGMHTLNELGRVSGPGAFGIEQGNLGAVALPTPPASLIKSEPSLDATSLYRAAEQDYLAHEDAYEKLNRAKEAGDIERIAAMKNLLAATHASAAALFRDSPKEIVTYRDKPQLKALSALGHLAARAGLLKQVDSPVNAVQYFEAEFALGARMYEERLTVDEFTRGIELLSESAGGLSRVLGKANQPDRGLAFRTFDDSRKQYVNERVMPLLKVLQSIDANIVGEHAGDIIYLARHGDERMFRVEAIFAMGRMRFFAGENGRIGDQRGALQELKRLAEDPDPVIRQAATEARDLKIEEYRMLK